MKPGANNESQNPMTGDIVLGAGSDELGTGFRHIMCGGKHIGFCSWDNESHPEPLRRMP